MNHGQGANKDVVVSVKNVSKKFCRNLKRSMAYGILDLSKNLIGVKSDTTKIRKDEFWALENVNFELKKGEALGLVGMNGSGKTTLLRLLSGIFPPDRGEILMKGRVGALIAVGAGFHPHMTGRENIYLNGAILGISAEEIKKNFDDIVNFAEIGKFVDSPVSTYSSGMRIRLGFSIATSFNPDVLLVDEILAVGDTVFRRRCFDRMRSVLKNAAIILVSHQIRHIEQFCDRVLLVDQGKILSDGPAVEITKEYISMTNRKIAEFSKKMNYVREGSHEISYTDNIRVYGEKLGANRLSHEGEDLIVEAEFVCNKPMDSIRFRVGIEDLSSGALITAANCHVPHVSCGGKIRCIFKNLTLRPHAYAILLAITDLKQVIDLWAHALSLVVEGGFSTKVQYSITDRELIYIPHTIHVDTYNNKHEHFYKNT